MTQFKNSTFHIVYQDNDLVAVNKPAGILCVPGLSTPVNLFDSVKKRFPNARVVHRLDMATSGLVLFALHHPAQKNLGQMFENRNIRKSYSAIVHGIVKDDTGEIHSSIICDWPNRPKQKIDWVGGKKAITYFNVTQRIKDKNQTRVLLHPHTGRTHQLRVHMLQIGHAIIGDAFYQTLSLTQEHDRLLLHAETLEFPHPMHNTKINLHCPPAF